MTDLARIRRRLAEFEHGALPNLVERLRKAAISSHVRLRKVGWIKTQLTIQSMRRALLATRVVESDRGVQEEVETGVRWRKIKRGKQRIYILRRDGTTYIHFLKRKDWIPGEQLASRFLAA